MAVKIEGMEMPKSCLECSLRCWDMCSANRNIYVFYDIDNRNIGCPLQEVKE